MRKLIVIISSIAFAGSMAFAMEEAEMMEDTSPSVSVSGSAKMGIKNVSTEGNPHTDGMKLINEYEVVFSSSGVTDGGLMFGASISIDEDGGDVGGSSVYIGGADGAWKLKFGSPDPGIDSVGDIGIAGEGDTFYATNNHQIEFSGKFQQASFVITSNAPVEKDEDGTKPHDSEWSAGVNYDAGDIKVGVGMDSEKGLALGVGTDVSGVNLSLYYAKAEKGMLMNEDVLDSDTNTDALAATDVFTEERKGLGVKASMPAGEGATVSFAYSTNKAERMTEVDTSAFNGTDNIWMPNAETKLIELDFGYDLGGGATLNAGIDSKEPEGGNKVTTLEASISMSF